MARETMAVAAIVALAKRHGAMVARQIVEAVSNAGVTPVMARQLRAAEILMRNKRYAGEFTYEQLTATIARCRGDEEIQAQSLAAATYPPPAPDNESVTANMKALENSLPNKFALRGCSFDGSKKTWQRPPGYLLQALSASRHSPASCLRRDALSTPFPAPSKRPAPSLSRRMAAALASGLRSDSAVPSDLISMECVRAGGHRARGFDLPQKARTFCASMRRQIGAAVAEPLPDRPAKEIPPKKPDFKNNQDAARCHLNGCARFEDFQ